MSREKENISRILAIREEFLAKNNAKLPYEIEQIKHELKGLRAIAVEHYTVCPIRSPELVAWFEKEVRHSVTPASICHANRPSTTPPLDADYAGTGRRTSPLPKSIQSISMLPRFQLFKSGHNSRHLLLQLFINYLFKTFGSDNVNVLYNLS